MYIFLTSAVYVKYIDRLQIFQNEIINFGSLCQVKYIIGITIAKYVGPGRLIKTYIDLFQALDSLNYVALSMSIVCISVLLGYDWLIKPRMLKRCKLPVPMQFIVVIIATVVSYLLDLKTLAGIKVIGHVPTGLPSPELPDVSMMPGLIGDAFTITIIGYVVTLSIAKILADKFNYSVDPNQELIAIG